MKCAPCRQRTVKMRRRLRPPDVRNDAAKEQSDKKTKIHVHAICRPFAPDAAPAIVANQRLSTPPRAFNHFTADYRFH